RLVEELLRLGAAVRAVISAGKWLERAARLVVAPEPDEAHAAVEARLECQRARRRQGEVLVPGRESAGVVTTLEMQIVGALVQVERSIAGRLHRGGGCRRLGGGSRRGVLGGDARWPRGRGLPRGSRRFRRRLCAWGRFGTLDERFVVGARRGRRREGGLRGAAPVAHALLRGSRCGRRGLQLLTTVGEAPQPRLDR